MNICKSVERLKTQIGLSHYRFGIACICYQYANIQNTVANNGNIQVDNMHSKIVGCHSKCNQCTI